MAMRDKRILKKTSKRVMQSRETKPGMVVRILLGAIATEWRRMLLDLARDDGDLEIVGTAEHAMDVLLQAEELKVNVVVLSQLPDGHEPGVCSHLMLEFPNVA